MKHILILGGTGAMGTHLVSLLSKDPSNHIFVTSRNKHNNHDNISFIVGNAHDEDFLLPLLEKCHWTSIIDFMVYSTKDFTRKVNIFLKSTDQYVFLSSSRVYAQSDIPIKECSKRLLDVCNDTEYLATDEYAIAKARQENILMKSGKSNWTIIRPYITFSEKRLQLGVLEMESWLYRALQGRTIVIPKNILEKRTTLTYGYDVAKGIVALIGNSNAYNQAYHITANNNFTWKEILDVYVNIIENYTGKKVKIHFQDNNPYVPTDMHYYQLIYDRCFNRIFDNSKIGDFINTNCFMPTLDGLKLCLESFLKEPSFRNINWREEAIKDNLTKEFPRMKEFNDVKSALKYFFWRFIYFLKFHVINNSFNS